MDRPSDLIQIIDDALERFSSRELVHGVEVVDVLLDMRNAVLDTDELSRLLEEESAPQPG